MRRKHPLDAYRRGVPFEKYVQDSVLRRARPAGSAPDPHHESPEEAPAPRGDVDPDFWERYVDSSRRGIPLSAELLEGEQRAEADLSPEADRPEEYWEGDPDQPEDARESEPVATYEPGVEDGSESEPEAPPFHPTPRLHRPHRAIGPHDGARSANRAARWGQKAPQREREPSSVSRLRLVGAGLVFLLAVLGGAWYTAPFLPESWKPGWGTTLANLWRGSAESGKNEWRDPVESGDRLGGGRVEGTEDWRILVAHRSLTANSRAELRALEQEEKDLQDKLDAKFPAKSFVVSLSMVGTAAESGSGSKEQVVLLVGRFTAPDDEDLLAVLRYVRELPGYLEARPQQVDDPSR